MPERISGKVGFREGGDKRREVWERVHPIFLPFLSAWVVTTRVFIRKRGLRWLIRTLPDGHAQDFPALFRAPGHLRFGGVICELEPRGGGRRAPPEDEVGFHGIKRP